MSRLWPVPRDARPAPILSMGGALLSIRRFLLLQPDNLTPEEARPGDRGRVVPKGGPKHGSVIPNTSRPGVRTRGRSAGDGIEASVAIPQTSPAIRRAV